jgi:hypothetical protein
MLQLINYIFYTDISLCIDRHLYRSTNDRYCTMTTLRCWSSSLLIDSVHFALSRPTARDKSSMLNRRSVPYRPTVKEERHRWTCYWDVVNTDGATFDRRNTFTLFTREPLIAARLVAALKIRKAWKKSLKTVINCPLFMSYLVGGTALVNCVQCF